MLNKKSPYGRFFCSKIQLCYNEFMALIRLNSSIELDKIILSNPEFQENQGVFLQSGSWQNIWHQENKAFFSYAYYQANNCLGLLSASLQKAKFGLSYLYAPKGPLFIAAQKNSLDFLEEIVREVKNTKAIFLRFEPSSVLFDSWHSQNAKVKLHKVKDLQPSQTIQLDLTKSQDELLSLMHPKTRYNIRLAEKKDIEFRLGSLNDFSEFWHLMSTTAERDTFRLHDEDHYKILLNQSDFIRLFVVSHKNRIIAAGLFSFFADTATYLHGASSNSDRNLMAPYLLQWEVIKIAQREGYKKYDFYGIDAKRWPGVTRFKLGFGGKTLVYPGTYDLVLKPWMYKVYSILKRLKP